MTEEKKDSWRDYVQPVGMLAASSLNLVGAAVHQLTSDKDTNNPFYYTAMTTSAIYMASNAYATKRVYDSHVANELARRQKTAELEEVKTKK